MRFSYFCKVELKILPSIAIDLRGDSVYICIDNIILDIMSRYEEQKREFEQKHPLNGIDARIKHIQKLVVFNGLIKQLVKWKEETEGQREDDILKDLSFIPLMKCLYFVCLLSIHETSKKVDTLFDLFDFTAYPKGWVDEECYYSINELEDYHIKTDVDGKEYIAKREEKALYLDDGSNNLYIGNIPLYIQELGKAVKDLKEALFLPGFKDREGLVELSHDELWENAYSKPNSRMDISNWEKVFEMAKNFRMSVAA